MLDPEFEAETFSLLESLEKLEIYQQKYSDPDTFFGANYQKDFNHNVNLMLEIRKELKKLNHSLKR